MEGHSLKGQHGGLVVLEQMPLVQLYPLQQQADVDIIWQLTQKNIAHSNTK